MLRGSVLGTLGLAGAALIGCSSDDDDAEATIAPAPVTTATLPPTPATAAATAAATAEATAPAAPPPPPPPRAELIVLSNSSPHITVVDAQTNRTTRTADIPDFTSWTWNDDNNFLDGSLLWLGTKDRDTNEVTIVTLDLDSLIITNSIPIGADPKNVYIGKPLADLSIVHVGMQGTGRVVAINPKTYEVISTFEGVPLGTGEDGVVCDADISVGSDGVERFVYPTLAGDSIVTLNPRTGETLAEVATPEGSRPVMLSAAPDGNIWVQDAGSNTNSIYDPVDLRELARVPAGTVPVLATFSPDGKLAYIGHSRDTIVQVLDTETFEEVTRITAGTSAQKVAVHPDGTRIYAILTKEAAVAVIDTASWTVVDRIEIGTNPTTPFVRTLA